MGSGVEGESSNFSVPKNGESLVQGYYDCIMKGLPMRKH